MLHWQAKRRLTKPLADRLAWEVKAAAPSMPLPQARVTMTIRKMGIPFDTDNAVAAMKALQDALVRGGLIANDTQNNIKLTVNQERKRGREVHILVEEGWDDGDTN